MFGASGYIGSHVVEQLLAAGHAVTAVIRASSDRRFLDTTQATVTIIDFNNDTVLREVIVGHDVVYNCLAEPKIHNDEKKMRIVEIDLTRRVLHAAAAAAAKRFVQLSTIQVYGFNRPADPIDETYPLKPTYAFNRVCAERETMVLDEAKALGLALVILRPVNVLGARDPQFVAVTKAHRQGIFMMIGDGVRFSGIDARDAGRAMVFLGESPLEKNAVYLVRGFDTSWLEIKQKLDKLRGHAAKIIRLPKPLAWLIAVIGDAMPYSANPPLTRFSVSVLSTHTLFDDRKIRQKGFVPSYTLDDALDAY